MISAKHFLTFFENLKKNQISNLFLKNINLHISKQRLEIERNGQYLVKQNIFQHFENLKKFTKFKKQIKI